VGMLCSGLDFNQILSVGQLIYKVTNYLKLLIFREYCYYTMMTLQVIMTNLCKNISFKKLLGKIKTTVCQDGFSLMYTRTLWLFFFNREHSCCIPIGKSKGTLLSKHILGLAFFFQPTFVGIMDSYQILSFQRK